MYDLTLFIISIRFLISFLFSKLVVYFIISFWLTFDYLNLRVESSNVKKISII